MNPNPFSPSFGVDPNNFHGRKAEIEDFVTALATPGSARRYLILTGTRGCGKTSLLHQFALRTEAMRWDVIEATNIDALDRVLEYVGLGKSVTRKKAFAPAVSANDLGSVSLGELSSTTAEANPPTLLSAKLRKKLQSMKASKGLAILVDEAQKLSEADVVLLGNAVQHSRVAGLPIAFVLCGLPNTYSKVRGYSGSTFLRRMKRLELWCLKPKEASACMRALFARVPEIKVSEPQMEQIIQFSGGHPYLIQLVGDNLYNGVVEAYGDSNAMEKLVTEGLVEAAEHEALAAYVSDVLSDVLTSTRPKTRAFIKAAFDARNERGRAHIKDICRALGAESPQRLSSVRSRALNTQVIRPAGYGWIKFALPHYQYIYEDFEYDRGANDEEDWDY